MVFFWIGYFGFASLMVWAWFFFNGDLWGFCSIAIYAWGAIVIDRAMVKRDEIKTDWDDVDDYYKKMGIRMFHNFADIWAFLARGFACASLVTSPIILADIPRVVESLDRDWTWEIAKWIFNTAACVAIYWFSTGRQRFYNSERIAK